MSAQERVFFDMRSGPFGIIVVGIDTVSNHCIG